jgi:hypothetical protein
MNDIFKRIGVLLALIIDQHEFKDLVFDAMEQNGTPISKSRIQGWSVSSDNKNYRHMKPDEMKQVLDAIIEYYRNQ